MKKLFHDFIILFTVVAFILSCNTPSKLHGVNNKNRISSGKLSDLVFNDLVQILETTNTKINDTLIIKYDYNKEKCWNTLDQKNDDYIKSVIVSHQLRMHKVESQRPHISVFNYREPGSNLNKIKKWDNSILIDQDKRLFNLLFSQRSTCGNSMIIMSDRQFILIRSDSHLEALDLTQNKIKDILK